MIRLRIWRQGESLDYAGGSNGITRDSTREKQEDPSRSGKCDTGSKGWSEVWKGRKPRNAGPLRDGKASRQPPEPQHLTLALKTFQISDLQNSEIVHWCCSSHEVGGNLLQQPWEFTMNNYKKKKKGLKLPGLPMLPTSVGTISIGELGDCKTGSRQRKTGPCVRHREHQLPPTTH